MRKSHFQHQYLPLLVFIYMKRLGQQNVMYLVKSLDQIHQLY